MKHNALAIAALSGLVACSSASGSDDSVQEALKDYAFATCLISQEGEWSQQGWSWAESLLANKLTRAGAPEVLAELAAVVRSRAGDVPMRYGRTLPHESPTNRPLVVMYCGELVYDADVRSAIAATLKRYEGLR